MDMLLAGTAGAQAEGASDAGSRQPRRRLAAAVLEVTGAGNDASRGLERYRARVATITSEQVENAGRPDVAQRPLLLVPGAVSTAGRRN